MCFFRNVDALKYVLTNAPLGSKQQAAKGTNTFCPWIGGYIYSFKKSLYSFTILHVY
jgi:hypothetical protein